jgi:hypothetical protein
MALALDGHAATIINTSGTTAASVTLTTTSADGAIVAYVTIFTNQVTNSSSTAPGVLNVSGGGLTWGLCYRTRLITSVSSLPLIVEKWVARAPSALTAQTITASMGGVGTSNFMALEVFGVSGADTDAIFDTNSSLPAISAFAASGGTSSHPVTGISTTNANTFEIATLATAAGGTGTPTADSGFTLLDSKWFNSTTAGQQAEYKINSSLLSSVSQNVFSSVSAISTNYIALVDAIVAAPGSARAGPKFVNSGGGTLFNSTSATGVLPSSRVNGNLLLAHLSVGSATAVPAWPAGWTVIETWTIGTQTGSKAYCYVTGSETAPTVTWTGTAAGMIQIVQISGAAPSSPIGSSSHNSASSASVTCSTITTTRANSLVLNFIDVGEVLATPAPYPWRSRVTGGGTSPSVGCWHIADEFLPTSGSTSDSVNLTLYASCTYLNFTTEILTPAPGGRSSTSMCMGIG